MMSGPAGRLRRAARDEATAHASLAAPAVQMPPALSLDLLAAVLASGASPHSAVLAMAQALEQAGEPAEDLIRSAERLLDGSARTKPADLDPELGDALSRAIGSALSLSRRSGLPPAELLKAAATRERARRSMQARATIRRLEVLLIIPAGICLLPAFVVLGVVPVVIALFGG